MTSLWGTAAIRQLSANSDEPLHRHSAGDFDFEIKVIGDALWVITGFGKGQYAGFRAAYSPGGFDGLTITDADKDIFSLQVRAAIGTYEVTISWPAAGQTVLHYTATLTPAGDLSVPF